MKTFWRLCLLLTLLVFGGLLRAVAAEAKPVMVHYRPWFSAKPFSSQWGWHWTMDRYNPDQVDATGQRRIASWYRPLIGPYDGANPDVLEYHVLQIKLAGIDGVIVDWYGPDEYLDYAANNERTKLLFDYARLAGLKFALCYEDQAIEQQVARGTLAASNAIARAQQHFLYAESNFLAAPCYLRERGRPILLNFGPQHFKTSEQWESIFTVLQSTNQPALFTEDYRLPVGSGGFSWPPMWLSVNPGTRGVLSINALQSYFDRFEDRAKSWPAFISSAFPRFHDIYQSAGVRDYIGYLGDRKGRTFGETLSRALTNGSAIVQIVTWNDFGEGTMVEPTIEYGYRDLGIIQEQRRLYLDSKFSYTTNDLTIPYRLYQLRVAASTNQSHRSQLDEVAAAVIKGELRSARAKLEELETRRHEGSSK